MGRRYRGRRAGFAGDIALPSQSFQNRAFFRRRDEVEGASAAAGVVVLLSGAGREEDGVGLYLIGDGWGSGVTDLPSMVWWESTVK